jgi:hypothetical protein
MMGRHRSVRAAFLRGLCWLGLAAPCLFPAAGRADLVAIVHPPTNSTLKFFVKEQAAFCTQAGSKKDPDLWELGRDQVQLSSEKHADLWLGVDARTGAVRFGERGEKGLVTRWRIYRRPEGPCTFRVAEGRFKGWVLCVAEKAEKRVNGEGQAVRAFPLVLVPEEDARCVFKVAEVSK